MSRATTRRLVAAQPQQKEKKEESAMTQQDDAMDAQLLKPQCEQDLIMAMPRLNKFTPGTFPQISLFSTVTVYGKRKSGKTVFVKWFMQAYKHLIPWAWIFTRTKFNASYESWLPNRYIITTFDSGVLRDIMHRQEVAIVLRLSEDPKLNPRAWVAWDDYNGKDVRYNEVLEDYYYTGRHYWTLNTFCAQHITLTPPAIRANTDLVVLFNTDYADSLEHYWKDFAGKMDYMAFRALFTAATCEANHFLAIDNNPNTPYEEKFFTGIAEMLDEDIEYIFGCESYWRENLNQLRDIYTGKFKKFAEETHAMAEWVPFKKQPKPVAAPSAWQPYHFPAANPDRGQQIDEVVQDQKEHGKPQKYGPGSSDGGAGVTGAVRQSGFGQNAHLNNPRANPRANINTRPAQPQARTTAVRTGNPTRHR